MALAVDEAIEALAELNDDPAAGGITREVYTPTYMRALELVGGWMEEAGLEVRLDPVGNLFGRTPATDRLAPVVMTGSHIDTTLNAGRFDGVVGVVGAIAAVGELREEGFEPARALEVVAWAGEEPRFGTGCLGSRCAAGTLGSQELERLVDRDGVTFARALRDASFDPARVADAVIDPAGVHALVELHIEQGAVLEVERIDVGVVTAIAAPHDFTAVFEGAATHAGATPMGLRRDALAGAAEWMVELERLAQGSQSGTTVATVGVLRGMPGAINVVPGRVELDVDVRDSDAEARERVVAAALRAGEAIAARRGLGFEATTIVNDAPVACDARIVDVLETACAERGVKNRRMVSGAYHDAMMLGANVPVGMLFVPSAGGISHHPDEFTTPAQIAVGVEVLRSALARLAT